MGGGGFKEGCGCFGEWVGEPFEYSPKMKIHVRVCGSICGQIEVWCE